MTSAQDIAHGPGEFEGTHGGWDVFSGPPCDWFDDLTIAVADWLPKAGPWLGWYLSAAEAFRIHSFQEELRQPPRVAYDPGVDGPMFIYKLDNNGITYVVRKTREVNP